MTLPRTTTIPQARLHGEHLSDAEQQVIDLRADANLSARPCQYGHGRVEHQHYRRGTDCSAADYACAHYSRPLLARLHLSH